MTAAKQLQNDDCQQRVAQSKVGRKVGKLESAVRHSLSSFPVVMLGTILSLNHQLINVTAYDTSALVPNVSTTNNFTVSPSVAPKEYVPVFEMVLGTITYLVIILMTLGGNTLVIVAVFTYRPLKKVQNYFLVSLAASDLAVGLFVMPLHVVKFLANGHWLLGVTVCQLFTTADILLCTSSILNLCAIALDRYWAICYPLTYAQKRTLRFVCLAILLVWFASAIISIPPILGWNDWSSQKLKEQCELTTEKTFVVYSALGSFFVPLLVMLVVYLKIFMAARRRIRTNRGRSALVRITKQQSKEKRSSNTKRLTKTSISLNDSRKLVAERAPLVVDPCSGITNGDMSSETKNSDETRPAKVSMQQRNSQSSVDPATLKLLVQDSKGNGLPTTNLNSAPAGEQLTTTVLKKREKISVAKEKRSGKDNCCNYFGCHSFVPTLFYHSANLATSIQKYSKDLYGLVTSTAHLTHFYTISLTIIGILNLEFRRAFRKILCPKQFMGRRRSTVIRH
ncbi:Tyramine receptor ser-2 [Aphelenchoides bicaudatus]|nr:Tyramine receptor ser-2 [Aphelenchoides bicaudatus]